jgi:protease-4
MPLDADHVIDRRRLKRRLAFWRVLGVAAVVAAVVAGVSRFGLVGRDFIARVNVEGIVYDDPWRDRALAAIAENSNVRALIVRINSPGGTVAGGEALYRNLRRLSEKKPVVAMMAEVATSGGYMAALGADYIVARGGSITGSIGVILQTTDITGLLEKIGIKPVIIKSSPLKAQPSPLEPLSPEGRAAARVVVLDFFDMFVDMIAERRRMPRDSVLALADGRIFTGRQAKENGLVDVLGGESEAQKWLFETRKIPVSLSVRDVEIERHVGLWRKLLGGVFGKMLFSERLRLDGLVSLWHPQ